MFDSLKALFRKNSRSGQAGVNTPGHPPAAEERNGEKGTHNAVAHPSHYNSGSIEVIDFVEDQQMGFHLGNATKYICRAGKKNPEKEIEDLEKAVWYINRWITVLRKKKEGGQHDV